MAVTADVFEEFAALPLFDETMLGNLRAALGPATDMLVAKADGILADRITRLQALQATPLDDGVARLAHEIGGVAGQIGLARLSKASLALERLCRSGDSDGTAAAMGELAALTDASRAAITR